MRYKITVNNKKYVVSAKDVNSALSALAEFEDGVSPMTYKKLKEEGYTREDWKDWSDEEKFEKSQTGGVNHTKSSKEQPSEQRQSQKQHVAYSVDNAKKIADKYTQFANRPDVQELVKKIDNKQYMPLDELRKHPAIQQMEHIIHEYDKSIMERVHANDGVVIPLEEQQQIKEELLRRGSVSGVDEKGDAIYEGPVKHEKKVVIAIGLPAAGKSTRIVNKISGPMGAVVIDSDEAKFLSKEFQATNGVAANAIHEDSQNIIKSVFEDHLKTGANMIIPVIGSNWEKLRKKWIDKLEQSGYDVEIQFQDANPVDSANRVVGRAVGKGRPMSSDIIFGYGDKPRAVFEQLEGKLNAQGKPYTNRNKTNI